MAFLIVKRIVLIVAAAAACYGLAERFGSLTASLIWAGAAASACGIGTVLLRTSALGRVTWRNRTAAYLVPWGWRLNKGRLWPIPVVSWVVWVVIGAVALLLRTGDESLGFRFALFSAWMIDAAALVHVLGAFRQATTGSRFGPLGKLAAIITVMIAASVGLYIGGEAGTSLAVGGGPPLVIGACFGFMLLFFVTVGRNTRWN